MWFYLLESTTMNIEILLNALGILVGIISIVLAIGRKKRKFIKLTITPGKIKIKGNVANNKDVFKALEDISKSIEN